MMGMFTIPQKIFKRLLLISGLIVISSCVTSNLQTASVKDTESKSAVHLAKDDYNDRVTLRPYYFRNTNQVLKVNTGTHTKVNRDGIYELEATDEYDLFIEHKNVNTHEFTGKNLNWDMPSSTIGGDLELTFSHIMLTLGFQHGNVGGHRFLNGIFGFSLFTEKKFRIGFNVYSQSPYSDVVVMHVDDNYSNGVRDVEMNTESREKDFVNYDFYLNWRSDFQKNILFDIFIEGAFGAQTLVDVKNISRNSGLFEDSEKMYYKDDFKNLTFGVFKKLTPNSKLISGYKMNFHDEQYTGSDIRTDSFFLQFEIDLFLSE